MLGLFSFDYLLPAPVDGVAPGGPITVVREHPGEACREFPLYVDEIQRGMELACWEHDYALLVGGPSRGGGTDTVTDIAGHVDGLAVFAGNDDALARAADLGLAGGICVATHLVGTEMKQLWEEPDRRAEVDAALQDVYAACFCTNSPAPTKEGLRMLGIDTGPVRLPLTDCDEAERETMRRALAGVGATA